MSKSPHTTDVYVGNCIRMRRLMLDLNQTDLARALGITFQQVQKYEKGTNRVSASRLQYIASVMQVPIPFFFEDPSTLAKGSKWKPDGHSLAAASKFTATPDGLSLIKAFTKIRKPKLRLSIVRLIEEVARKVD